MVKGKREPPLSPAVRAYLKHLDALHDARGDDARAGVRPRMDAVLRLIFEEKGMQWPPSRDRENPESARRTAMYERAVRLRETHPVREVAQIMGMSQRTVYKLLADAA